MFFHNDRVSKLGVTLSLVKTFLKVISRKYTAIYEPCMKELADYLKIAEKTAYRFASEGKVPGFKVGSAWRFRKSEIDRWISEQERKEVNDG